jgi:hypothetical protein
MRPSPTGGEEEEGAHMRPSPTVKQADALQIMAYSLT